MKPTRLPTCCMDMDIYVIDLVFPERMSEEGQEFVTAHGLNNTTIAELFNNAVDLTHGMIKIFHRCQHLQDDGACAIYESRPRICKEFDCGTRSDCACKGSGVMNRAVSEVEVMDGVASD